MRFIPLWVHGKHSMQVIDKVAAGEVYRDGLFVDRMLEAARDK